jgi:hypothetical protein
VGHSLDVDIKRDSFAFLVPAKQKNDHAKHFLSKINNWVSAFHGTSPINATVLFGCRSKEIAIHVVHHSSYVADFQSWNIDDVMRFGCAHSLTLVCMVRRVQDETMIWTGPLASLGVVVFQ